MIIHNADLFIYEAFDDYFMTQTLRFFIWVFQNTEIVITILFFFLHLPRIWYFCVCFFRGVILLHRAAQLVIREQEEISSWWSGKLMTEFSFDALT